MLGYRQGRGLERDSDVTKRVPKGVNVNVDQRSPRPYVARTSLSLRQGLDVYIESQDQIQG